MSAREFQARPDPRGGFCISPHQWRPQAPPRAFPPKDLGRSLTGAASFPRHPMPAPKGNKNAKGNRGGSAPTAYDPKYAAMAKKACEAGFTDLEMGELLGVSVRTINYWKTQHLEFLAALVSGKGVADERVERSLYHKAVGYSFDAVKIMQYEGQPVVVPYREHVPPDTTAAMFWLRNRRKDQWRDVQRIEHGEAGEFDRLADEEVLAEMRKEAAELGLSTGKLNGRGNGTAH